MIGEAVKGTRQEVEIVDDHSSIGKDADFNTERVELIEEEGESIIFNKFTY